MEMTEGVEKHTASAILEKFNEIGPQVHIYIFARTEQHADSDEEVNTNITQPEDVVISVFESLVECVF
jgi:regulator of PEP synthase PpsR (kinase-PPPase family)